MKRFNMLALYFHTLRYMKFSQVYWKLYYHFKKNYPVITSRPKLRSLVGNWIAPISKQVSLVGERKFCFLNESHEINSPVDWNNPSYEKLWLYNLHYFDDLNAKDAYLRRQQHNNIIDLWVKDNAPGKGNGWEPYPTSLRIVNWIKWSIIGNCLNDVQSQSLATQVRFLFRKLEWHLLGNHLFANAKALVFAGLFFEGDEADKWLRKGLSIIDQQIPEQVLKDGGNFELSPMYHVIFLEDSLDLINIARVYQNKNLQYLEEIITRMITWLQVMMHPDGQISFFNDCAFGVAADPVQIFDYVKRLNIASKKISEGIVTLDESGYIRIENSNAVVIFDCAKVGPDYIPGHAHADSLSFECSLFGKRVVVNSGTSCYGVSEERLRQRSTEAHSTVSIDDENSSEVWGGFRVARRANPINLKVSKDNQFYQVSCAHNGYLRLKGEPMHTREICLDDDFLIVKDIIDGVFKKAVGRIFLHPQVSVEVNEDKTSGMLLFDGYSVSWQLNNAEVLIRKSSYHPEFGNSEESICIEYLIMKNRSEFVVKWN